MRRVLLLTAFALYFGASAHAQSPKPQAKTAAKTGAKADAAHIAQTPSPLALNDTRASFAKLPLSFEENTGQTDSRVKFTSRGAGYNLFLTGDEAVFSLRGSSALANCSPLAANTHANCADATKNKIGERSVLWMKMLGANSSAQVSGADPTPGKINYYMGNDRSKWRTGVTQYGRVSYRGIYPGIDLTYYGNQQQLESDFILAPGADPRAIEFEVKGARDTRLDARGNLVLVTNAGNVQLLRPGIYQTVNGVRRDISGHYVLRGKDRVAFAIGAYDRHEKLIIDPTLVYSTFLGGSALSGGDGAQAIAIDSSGHAYVTGQGTSADFPGSDPSGPPVSSFSTFVFVTEFDPTGSSAGAALVYSTILSGGNNGSYLTIGNGIGVDASGNAYIAGNTSATDFPMVNPFQSTYGSPTQSGFVAGLAAGTGALNYSTYLGGRNYSDTTELQNLATDSTGNVYVVGDTTSPNFPTVAPLRATLNGYENVVVAKFNPQGQPLYSTYLGGNGSDFGTAIAVDTATSPNAYVTGYTSSTNFPVQTSPAPFQAATAGSYDVFVSKLSFSGTTLSLASSTYLGGSSDDEALGIAVDTATPPNVYLTGETTSSGTAPNGFPTTTGVVSTANAGGTDAFVTKLKGDFTALTYSTYLGGAATDIGYAIGLDSSDNAYVTGSTTSANFPTKLPLQSAIGGGTATNVFLTELNTTGTTLSYSTYLGGIAVDKAYGIAVDSTGDAYIAGITTSPNFPVVSGGAAGTNPYQGQLGGSGGNAFVAKISPAAAPSALNFFPPSFNFHDDGIGASSIETVNLSNNTAASAAVSGFVFGGADSGDFSLMAASAPCLTSGAFSLPAGTSCNLTVKFAPTDQDARTATLTVTYNSTSTSVMNLSGQGGVPEASLSTTSIAFGNEPLDVQGISSVTVTNTGGAPLQLGSAQISASTPANAAPYSLVTSGSNCLTAAIAPGGSCSIDVYFVPTAAGTFNASLLVNSNAAGSPATISMSGTGVQEVVVQPTSLEMGIQIVGSTSTNDIGDAYLVNGSGETINVTVTPGTGTDQGDFHVLSISGENSCSSVGALAPGGTCYLSVSFQPQAASATDGRVGSYTVGWTGTSIASVVPGSQVVNVMGTGVTGISLYTTTVTGPSEYVGFTEGSTGLEYVANGTTNPITVAIAVTGNNPGDFGVTLDPTCAPAGVIPAEAYCRVDLSFTPSAIGQRTANVAFNYTGSSSGQLLLSLSGTGIPGPVFVSTVGNRYLSQVGSFDFGSEIISTTTPEKVFLIRNAATTPLTVQSMTGPTNTDFKLTSDGTCKPASTPFTIPGGGSCTFGVTFTPSTTGSKESTSIVITDAYTTTSGVDSSSPHTLTLTGTGEPAAITVSVSTGGTSLLDFGNVQLNPTTVPRAAIYLTNAGNTSTTISWTGGAPALATGGSSTFALVASGVDLTTCTQSKVVLPQGGSCLIGVTFTPTAAGVQTSSVTFSDSIGGSHTVNIQGKGVGQGLLSLSTTTPVVTYQQLTFNQLEGTTSGTQSVTVANLGSGPLTITSLPINGTNTSNFTTLGSSTCAVGSVLPSGATGNTCVFNFTFTAPVAPGNSYEGIDVLANLGNNTTSASVIELSGNSLAGGFTLLPAAPINFGAVAVATSATSSYYTLTNGYPTSVTFGAASLPSGYSMITGTDSCSNAVIPASSSCNFEVSFTPATSGTFNGTLSFPYTGATGTPFNIALQGSGSNGVVANPNPLVFQYASAGNANLSSLNLVNGSTSAATITGVSAFTGTNASDFSIPSGDNFCPSATVLTASGGSCFIEVQFLSAVPGNFSAQFTVSYTIGGVAQTPLTVSVTASIPFSLVTATPNPVTFSTPQTVNTQSQTMNVTLANSMTASQAAYVNTVQISGNDFSLASPGIGNCYSIAAGSSCTIPIAFTPSAAGARTGTLTITDNSTTSPHVITLQGTGVAGTVSATPSSLAFPLENFGTPVTLGAVLSNTTGTAITINSVVFSGAYATNTGSGTCVDGNKVSAVTGSCVVYIKFTPNGATNPGTATVNYTVGAGPTTGSVIINLSGAGTNPAVNVNPSSINFGSEAVGTSSAATPVTLSNPTSSAATVSSLPSISGTNASDFSLGTNTCTSGFSLAATTGSCVVNVIFKPGASGGTSRAATLSITNSSNGTLTVALSGTATEPVAGLSGSTMTFGSFDTGVASGQQLVTLTNTGNGTLNISSVALAGTNAGDFALATPASGTDCRTVGSLAATATCNVAATFTPTATGSRTATITITDNATPATQVITLTGTGTVPAVTLNPTSIALGSQLISTTSGQFTSVLTNSGSGPLTITGVAIDTTTGNFADFTLVTPTGTGVADCRTTTTLAAAGTCTIAATFTPSAIGARTATVKISDNVSSSPQLLPLTGTGTAPNVSLNPATTLGFGNEIVSVKSATQVVTLTNSGTASLTLASAVIDPTSANPGDFAIVSGTGTTCTAGLVLSSSAGSNSCTVTLTFTPAATGARSASLKFTDNSNGTAGSTQAVSLTGTGQTAPTAALAPPSVSFGNQRISTTSAISTVTITNNGQATLSIASIALDAAGNPGDFTLTAGTTNPCTLSGGTVAGGANCTFNVAFKPTATGARTATVDITDNGNATGTAGTKQTVALSGTGTAPNAQVAATLAFGNQPINQTSTMALTLTNSGTNTLNLAASGAVAITAGTNSTLFGIAGTSTCVNGLAIAPNGTCTINVTFAPTAVGPSGTVTLVITDDSGAVTGTKQSVALSGTGVTASVNFSPSPVNFTPSQNVGTTSGNVTVTLTNSGGLAVQLAASGAVAISGTNASDFAIVPTGTTCVNSATVGVSGGACAVVLTFTPSGAGARTATLTVTDNANPTTQTVTLNGTGIAPIASLNPATTLAFGNEIVSVKSSTQVVTLTNSGTASLTLASAVIDPASANPGDFAIVSGTGTTCTAGAVIVSTAGSNSCTVTLTFTPAATGARSASLKFTDNSNGTAGSTQAVSLTGTGQTAPTAALAPPSVSFGNQRISTTSTNTTVTITNNGQAALSIASIVLDAAGNPGDFTLTAGTTNPCTLSGGTVAGGANCTFNVAFRPTATGARTATVDITDNGNATGTAGTKQTVALSGTGIAPSVQVVSTLAFNNQPVNLTATLPITLKNTGTDTLNLAATNAMAITANADSSFFGIGTSAQGTTCSNGEALAAGSTCTIVVTFAPTTVRPYGPVTLVITDDAGAVSGSTQSISISGAGVTSTVNFSPTSLSFGSQRTGVASAQMTSVLTNSASTALAISNVALAGTNPGDFQLATPTGGATDCRTIGSVPAAGTCTIAVTFTPTATGSRSATVSVTDNATGSPHSFSLTGTGTAPSVSLSSTTVAFANQIQTITSGVQTLTVTNSGTATLNISTVVLGGTNPADFAIVTGSGTTCVGAAVGFTAPNNTCTVALTFTPPTANPFTATLTFTDDASPTTQVANLSGTGVTPPTATPSAPSLTFGNQPTTTTSAAQTITLSNNGGASLSVTSITLAGTNPGDFAFASPATTCPTAANGQVAAGANCVLSVTFSPTATGTRTANIAIVVSGITNPAPITLTGTGTAPDVAIAKSHLGSFEVGTNNTYAIKLTNNGTAPTQKTITVTDTLPAGLSYVSASPAAWTCGANAQIVSCTNAGPIANGANTTLTLTVSVAPSAFPSVTNTATVADAGDSGTTDKSSTDVPTVVTAPDVTITATHSGDFTVNANGTYTIKATNGGTGPTNGGIVVTDTLPAGLSFVSNAGASWACVAGAQNAQIVTCTYAGAALAAAGGNSTFTLTASVAPGAFPSVTNNATVADPNDGKTTDKSAAADLTNIDNVVPTQSAFMPNLGLIAGATMPQQITIAGTGFNSHTQITFGSTAPLNSPLSNGTANAAGTSLTIMVPTTYLATANAGTLTLTVTNPKNPTSSLGGGVASTTQSFPLIALAGIAPQSGTSTPVPVVAGTPTMLQMNLSLTPTGATLPADVTFACTLPSSLTGATCTPSPATLAHGTTSTSTTITINAIAMKSGGTAPSRPGNYGPGPRFTYLLWFAIACFLSMIAVLSNVGAKAPHLRRAPMYVVFGLLVLATGALMGCTAAGPTPTPVGPSTITVTATTADGATVTATVNLSITN